MKTKELDTIARKELKRLGAESSFKGYRGYPATVCVSVNDEIVHGIPGDRVMKNGDIVALDFGAIYKGFQGDAAVTVPVGEASPEAMRLIEATRGSLESGIAAARAGAKLGDVSAAIQTYAQAGLLRSGSIPPTASAADAPRPADTQQHRASLRPPGRDGTDA
jgi:methionyl aminopeptidase